MKDTWKVAGLAAVLLALGVTGTGLVLAGGDDRPAPAPVPAAVVVPADPAPVDPAPMDPAPVTTLDPVPVDLDDDLDDDFDD